MSVHLHAATGDFDVVMKWLTSSAAYFAMVFGAGFVFGTVRVMWLVPMVGVRVAIAMFFAAMIRYPICIQSVLWILSDGPSLELCNSSQRV